MAVEIVGQPDAVDETVEHVHPGQGGRGRFPSPLPDRPAELVLQLLAQLLADGADLFDRNHGGPASLLGSLGAARIEARSGRAAAWLFSAVEAKRAR